MKGTMIGMDLMSSRPCSPLVAMDYE